MIRINEHTHTHTNFNHRLNSTRYSRVRNSHTNRHDRHPHRSWQKVKICICDPYSLAWVAAFWFLWGPPHVRHTPWEPGLRQTLTFSHLCAVRNSHTTRRSLRIPAAFYSGCARTRPCAPIMLLRLVVLPISFWDKVWQVLAWELWAARASNRLHIDSKCEFIPMLPCWEITRECEFKGRGNTKTVEWELF